MSARSLTTREADIFACVVDTAVAPADGLPAVRDTDAARAFAQALARSPAINALGLRAMLYALEVAPLALGARARLRRLDRRARTLQLERVLASRLGFAFQGLRAVAAFCYYGDDRVAARFGWHPDEVVARGRAVRAAEGRW